MTAPLFLVDSSALDPLPEQGDTIKLMGPEARHAVQVKRLRVGEPILVSDGSGRIARGHVSSLSGRDHLELVVDAAEVRQAPAIKVTVVLGIIKGERMEQAVSSLVEVGVDRIVPWASEHSVVRLKGDSELKLLGKWRRKASEATKQSRRAFVPEVTEPLKGSQLIEFLEASCGTKRDDLNPASHLGIAVVLHEEGLLPLSELELPETRLGTHEPTNVVLVLGPEGGISPDELRELERLDAAVVNIGDGVLRSATAATVAAGWILGSLGHWDSGRQAWETS